MDNLDRTVHGVMPDGTQVVRYDRAGTWYFEHPDNPRGRRIRVADAVQAVAKDGHWFPKRPGGMYFDAQVRKVRGL